MKIQFVYARLTRMNAFVSQRILRTLIPIILSLFTLSSNIAYSEEEPQPKPIFKLIKGQGIEVCEAYLKRLNVTEYLDNNPAKGRITEPLLEGFADLKPVPLTAEEIQRIYFKTVSFARYQNQDLVEDVIKYREKMGYREKNQLPPDKNLLDDFDIASNTMEVVNKSMAANQKTPFVRYQVGLDLDNDGVANDVVIKNNQGVYIVDNAMQRINEKRMNTIFANQETLDWPSVIQFPTLAFPVTVFSYKNRYYFDGNFNKLVFRSHLFPDVLDLYMTKDEPYLLGVFEHQHQQTHRICEYEWVNWVWASALRQQWINDFEAIYWGKP